MHLSLVQLTQISVNVMLTSFLMKNLILVLDAIHYVTYVPPLDQKFARNVTLADSFRTGLILVYHSVPMGTQKTVEVRHVQMPQGPTGYSIFIYLSGQTISTEFMKVLTIDHCLLE
jgi:hypothetical protein